MAKKKVVKEEVTPEIAVVETPSMEPAYPPEEVTPENVTAWKGETLLTYVNGIGRIKIDDMEYGFTEKPKLSFEFDALYLESMFDNHFYTLDGNHIPFTLEQWDELDKFIESFKNITNIPVYAYHKEYRYGMGLMSKDEAEEKGLGYTHLKPEGDPMISLWTGEQWEICVAYIRADGNLVLMPTALCHLCKVFFTEKEWAEFPKPGTSWDIWDFEKKEWAEGRKLEDVREQTISQIHGFYSRERANYALYIPTNEQNTFLWQWHEATSYLKDNTAETAFFDGMTEGYNALDSEHGGTADAKKETFIQRCYNHFAKDILKEEGRIHGEMYYFIEKARSCQSIPDLEAVLKEVSALFTSAVQV